MSKQFFLLLLYVHIYSINIEWKMEARNLVRRIKWRAALIVNSINRLKLEIKIDKLLSFFPSTTRGGLDWNAFEKKGRGGKKCFVSYYESNYERDMVMDANRIRCFVGENTFCFRVKWRNDRYRGRREGGMVIYDHYRCNRCAPLSPTVRRLPVRTTGGSENGN